MKTIDYKKHPPVINITKTTIDVLLKQDKPDQLIALYIFYCYTACWQQTLQVRATTTYAAEGLKWSTKKVQRVKKILVELNLVEDMQSRKKGQFGERYVRVFYTVQDKTSCTTKTTPKCLETGSNKCLDTNSRTPKRGGDSKSVIKKFDRIAATKLYHIITTHKNITLNTTTWPNIFRQLRVINKVSKERIKKVLIWYGHHINNEYVPVAHCAKTFRSKFTRLEDAMIKWNKEHYPSETNDEEVPIGTYRMGGDGNMGYFNDEE